jgi:putative FmdB family regulatory protein
VPTYQYACTVCDERLEAVQKFTDDPLTECPVCAGALRKVYSPVGVMFKGSGFYRNDSRAAANGSAAKSEGKSDGKGDGADKGADKGAKEKAGTKTGGDGAASGKGNGSASGDRKAAASAKPSGSGTSAA